MIGDNDKNTEDTGFTCYSTTISADAEIGCLSMILCISLLSFSASNWPPTLQTGAYLTAAFTLQHPHRVSKLILVSPVGVPEAPPEEESILRRGNLAQRTLLRVFRYFWSGGGCGLLCVYCVCEGFRSLCPLRLGIPSLFLY